MSPSSTVRLRAAVLAVAGGLATAGPARAQSIDPFYAGSYTLTDLGGPPGLPGPFGGLTLLAGDLNTLLIGGSANTVDGAIYSVPVVRGVGGHITGFGAASFFAAAPLIDGGLSYGPGGVLFYTGFPDNLLGPIKPGSAAPDRVDTLDPGLASVGGLALVPAGYPGAGQFKLLSYGQDTTATATPDGAGTYDISGYVFGPTLEGGLEGIAYVPFGSDLFPNPSALVSEWFANKVATYERDANGDPIPGTRRLFIDGLTGAEGALIDPITGDFLFSTFIFGGGDRVIRVSGFAPVAVPAPPAVVLAAVGGLGLLGGRQLRRKVAG
ncbi:MAG: hypothetical protein K2X87_12760 [Gemmataceae bacterium]|nr:hypothetical protein [Gemmataceae bacterium]